MIKLYTILNEVGEASAKPFKWTKKNSLNNLFAVLKNISEEQWSPFKIFRYEAQSENAKYSIRFGCAIKDKNLIRLALPGSKPKPKPKEKYDLIIYIAFNVVGARSEKLTGLNEQFGLMATVVQCITDFVKNMDNEIEIKEINIQPKSDTNADPNVDSKRGRLYLSYIKKNISKLPGKWTAYGGDTEISIKNGDWTGGNVIAKS